MQKGTASFGHTFFAAVDWFHPDTWPDILPPCKVYKKELQSNPWYLGRAISIVLCPPQLNSNCHLHLFFPLMCKWHFSCSTWDKTTPSGIRLLKWETYFCRKCGCRRVAGNCNTWLRLQLGWVSGTDSLMESCWVKDSKQTSLSQTASSFKERRQKPTVLPSLIHTPHRTSRTYLQLWISKINSRFIRRVRNIVRGANLPPVLFVFFFFQVYFVPVCRSRNSISDRRMWRFAWSSSVLSSRQTFLLCLFPTIAIPHARA